MSPRLVRALALPLLLGACAANGDFGRLKPGLVADDIHGWVGRDAVRAVGVPVSQYPLTDEERQLRDFGYPRSSRRSTAPAGTRSSTSTACRIISAGPCSRSRNTAAS